MCLAALLAVFTVAAVRAEEKPVEPAGTLSAALDRTSAPFGDVATLTLNFRLPEGGVLPDPPVLGGLEGLTVLGREVGPSRIALRLLVDQLETLNTGAITLTWLDKDARQHKLYADSVSLKVVSSLGDKPDEAALRPLQGIVPTRPPWLRHLPWILGALGLFLATAGLYWWLKLRRRRRESATLEEPPHLRAEREIGSLEAQRVFEKGRVKEYYFRLSEILRRYLEALRGFPAAEYTVEEIARSVREGKDRELLVLLRQADMVKFADDVPTAARKDDDLKAALAYVRDTAPVQEPQPAAGAPQEPRR